MRENIVKFGGELGATLEVYIATFCIFLQLFSNFSHFTQQLFAFYEHNRSMPNGRGVTVLRLGWGGGCELVLPYQNQAKFFELQSHRITSPLYNFLCYKFSGNFTYILASRP